jgi:hypothetical protein
MLIMLGAVSGAPAERVYVNWFGASEEFEYHLLALGLALIVALRAATVARRKISRERGLDFLGEFINIFQYMDP